jgi:ATP-binding cassette subfamily B (MDR/TAP) protein 1
MAAVLMASLPILAGAGGWMAVNLSSLTTIGEKSYRAAGGVAEQAVSGIRTVQALSGEKKEKDLYSYRLGEALETGLKKARINGMGFGIVMGSFIGTYALGLWFGSWLIINNKYNTSTGKSFSGGDVIMCFFAVVMGSFSVGQVMPAFQAFTKGRASAGRIWDVIERKPPIDVRDKGGEKPAEVKGDIEFKNVAFTYPARAEAPIFENLSISIKQGQEVALVGASGSGKSTIIQVRTCSFFRIELHKLAVILPLLTYIFGEDACINSSIRSVFINGSSIRHPAETGLHSISSH